MEKYIHIINNSISTNLEFTSSEELIKFNIETSCTIDFKYDTIDKKIVFIINNNIEVSINEEIKSYNGSSTIDIVYLINNNSILNNFIMSDTDNIIVNHTKEIKLLRNSYAEVNCAFFNDCSINYKFIMELDGFGSKGYHNLAAISRMKDKKKYDITINNNEKSTYGELNNFGVVKDSATLIFNGTGYIKSNSKKSESHQTSKIITFGESVNAQTNPYLIIDENDVKASHAAAVGKMDEDQLYYIQSRGINSENASKLVTFGYLMPIIDKINNDNVKIKLQELIEKKVGL